MSAIHHIMTAIDSLQTIPDYLCFTALEAGTFTLTIKASVGVGNLRYIEWSKDGRTWNHVDNEASVEKSIPVDVAIGDKVYWRGQGVNMTSSSAAVANCSQFSSTARFDVSGHIMSLLKGDDFLNYQHLTNYDTDGVRNVTFTYLFYGCTTLVNAKDLILPTFTSYYTYIFQYMFRSCTALVSAPNLPSSDTAAYCYGYMFNLCTSLMQAPSSIAATTLRTQCCRSMFEGDTALVTAPSIAATTLVGGSELYRTFSGCTSLVTPPSDLLPTSINVASYYMTFNNCSSMTTMPTLHFTSIASDGVNACLNMFSGCTSLTGEVTIDVPSAPKSAFNGTFGSTRITKAYVRCPIAGDESFRGTFFNVHTLSDIDIIGATSVGVNAYLSCFYGCRATRQNIVLPATILAEGCYKQMFYSSGYTINKVTCLATDISATDCLTNWLANAASTGTFIQASGVTWPRGASGIPTGWLAYDEGEEIPNDYTPCDYIYNSSTGGGGVDLGFKFRLLDYSVEAKFKQDEINNGMVCGTNANDSGAIWYYNYTGRGSFRVYACYSGSWRYDKEGFTPIDTDTHIIRYVGDADGCYLISDGTQSTSTNLSTWAADESTNNLFIFGRAVSSNTYKGRIYYLKVWNTATEDVICNLIPCSRNSDGAAGFWDTAQKQFFTSTYWTAHFDNE